MGVMGSGKFPPAFTGEYRFGGDKGKLYLFPLESDGAASDLFEWYRSEIGTDAESPLAGEDGMESFIGEAPYRGQVLVFRTGDFMGIMTGLPVDSKEADATVSGAARNIREASGG
jgi:hypothetical protein